MGGGAVAKWCGGLWGSKGVFPAGCQSVGGSSFPRRVGLFSSHFPAKNMQLSVCSIGWRVMMPPFLSQILASALPSNQMCLIFRRDLDFFLFYFSFFFFLFVSFFFIFFNSFSPQFLPISKRNFQHCTPFAFEFADRFGKAIAKKAAGYNSRIKQQEMENCAHFELRNIKSYYILKVKKNCR